MGAEVDWDGSTGKVTIANDDYTIMLYTGSNTAYINDDVYELERSAEVVNGRTLVPLRFVAEAFGNNVEWDGTTRTVYIS